eukprot:11395272-Alexandrium_andersonii.AAC.1
MGQGLAKTWPMQGLSCCLALARPHHGALCLCGRATTRLRSLRMLGRRAGSPPASAQSYGIKRATSACLYARA